MSNNGPPNFILFGLGDGTKQPPPPEKNEPPKPERPQDFVWDIVDEDGQEFTIMAHGCNCVGTSHFVFYDVNGWIVTALRNPKKFTPRYGNLKP